MALDETLVRGLKLPLICAPMFLVSGPELVSAACRNGVIGAFPTANARTPDILNEWLLAITGICSHAGDSQPAALWAANLVTHPTNARFEADLALVEAYRAPIVISALGGPARLVERAHRWGGKVFADVNSVPYARKAVDAGVDGLILVSSGAGGHTGAMNGLAFLEAVRAFFAGPVALGGGLSTGAGIRAVEVAGADLAVMGTAFIATHESLATPPYKQMLVDAEFEDLTLTSAVTGVPANWLRSTLIAEGMDPNQSSADMVVDFTERDSKPKRWKNVWSAGHGVGGTKAVESAGDLIAHLHEEYLASARAPSRFIV